MGPRVVIKGCEDYEGDRVYEALSEAVGRLGGMGRFVNPGERVLLKVNLLVPRSPDSAVVTHPSFVRAVVKLVQEAGGVAVIGDSPGGPFRRAALKLAYRASGLLDVAEETGAELNYNVERIRVRLPEGSIIRELELMEAFRSVDRVLPLPKVKTHCLTRLSCATKILFGLVPGTVKAGYHGKLRTRENFARMLVDIVNYVRPRLILVDGILAMEKNGPTWGNPRWTKFVLAGEDAFAVDLVVCRLLGLVPESVPMLVVARKQGLVRFDEDYPEVLGGPISTFHIDDFLLPTQEDPFQLLPGFLQSFVANVFTHSPYVNEHCVACGECVRNCPQGAISLREGRISINHSRCIRCYCCDELCPHDGISLRSSRLGRLMERLHLT
jgi:uncharacterized protein (DUF362 family)/Pyruvate/2-oxoacid:ferredoxin oxidoreductase delta subunit